MAFEHLYEPLGKAVKKGATSLDDLEPELREQVELAIAEMPPHLTVRTPSLNTVLAWSMPTLAALGFIRWERRYRKVRTVSELSRVLREYIEIQVPPEVSARGLEASYHFLVLFQWEYLSSSFPELLKLPAAGEKFQFAPQEKELMYWQNKVVRKGLLSIVDFENVHEYQRIYTSLEELRKIGTSHGLQYVPQDDDDDDDDAEVLGVFDPR